MAGPALKLKTVLINHILELGRIPGEQKRWTSLYAHGIRKDGRRKNSDKKGKRAMTARG